MHTKAWMRTHLHHLRWQRYLFHQCLSWTMAVLQKDTWLVAGRAKNNIDDNILVLMIQFEWIKLCACWPGSEARCGWLRIDDFSAIGMYVKRIAENLALAAASAMNGTFQRNEEMGNMKYYIFGLLFTLAIFNSTKFISKHLTKHTHLDTARHRNHIEMKHEQCHIWRHTHTCERCQWWSLLFLMIVRCGCRAAWAMLFRESNENLSVISRTHSIMHAHLCMESDSKAISNGQTENGISKCDSAADAYMFDKMRYIMRWLRARQDGEM